MATQESEPRDRDQDDIEDAPEMRDREEERRLSTADLAGAREPESEPSISLLQRDDATRFRGRWEEIQTQFVDEPRQSVEAADQLVADVMQRVAQGFAREREQLEGQWSRGEDVSTEDLRVTLQRYRSFFERLLAA